MNALYYLRLQAARGVGSSAQRAIFAYIQAKGMGLGDFFAASQSAWREAGLTPDQADALAASAADAEEWHQKIESCGIQIIGYLDEAYPVRLKRILQQLAPPVLYIKGNVGLLNMPAVGFCGSRDATERGIEVARDTVEQVSQKGWTTVSGHARGIDIAAHQTALAKGGTTVIVAPEGLFGFNLRSEIKSLVNQHNTLIVSEFQPNARWSTANAMTRNHTICGLSDALVVVQAGLSGGTFEAGKFALRVKVPLFVADYAQPDVNAPGNPYFIQSGARPVRKSSETGRANLHDLFQEVAGHYETLDTPSEQKPIQQALFPLDAAR
jgi:DNA processing protein